MSPDGKIPFTRECVTPEIERQIRVAVRCAQSMQNDNPHSRIAAPNDAALFFDFLSDPAIHLPIYTLPIPLTLDSVRTFIVRHCEERERGDGLLFLNFDEEGKLGGYTDLSIWPNWAAGELGGAIHPRRQGKGNGHLGAQLGFDWMFKALGLHIICETAAPDNVRTARLLDTCGFRRVGKINSVKPDGTMRPSLVWEVSYKEWDMIPI